MKGKLTLVGAGPGDPGLFTIGGRDALLNAQVVVYDRLVSPAILSLIPESAEKINVGKESSNHPVPQHEINKILLEKTREGKNVVRLKGGDPFVFGRGGEELEQIVKEGMDFQVIPGITSAVSAPAYGGIPVTHRDFCSSLHIITGHARENRPPQIDFEALKNTKGTLVFLMGVTSLPYICQGLITAGMPPDTPAAMVQNGTLPSQRRLVSTLGSLVEDAKAKNIKSPAVIIVGEVCSLSDDFCWMEKLPLFGRKIVVTRPKERAGTLSEKLRNLGAEVFEYPCIETVGFIENTRLENAFREREVFSWAVFTSPAGVSATMAYLFSRGLDVRVFSRVKLAAIGSATAAELKKYGLIADLVPKTYDADNLGTELAEKASGKVLILRAKEGSPLLTKRLDDAGVSYEDVAVYETIYRSDYGDILREQLKNGEIDAVTFTSASTVNGFTRTLDSDDYANIQGICIGEQTAAAAREKGISCAVAEKATIDLLVQAALKCLER